MTLSTTSDRINAQGGLFLVGKALERSCQLTKLTQNHSPSHNKQFSDCDILKLAVGLLAEGRTHFYDAELFRQEGNDLLIHDVAVELYWKNLGDSPQEIIKLYHDHGTSEQFHSEIKTDMGIERFPSKSFAVNALFLQLGAIAYNILRVINSHVMIHVESWPLFYRKKGLKQTRRRVGSVIRD